MAYAEMLEEQRARTMDLIEQGSNLEEAHEDAELYLSQIQSVYDKSLKDVEELKAASKDELIIRTILNAYAYGLAVGYNLKM